MKILIGITPLIVFIVFFVIISIQDWITDMRFYRRRHLRELRRAMHPEFFSRTHDVSADEIRKALDKQKVGTVTSLHSNEEEMGANLDEAERLIKEARNKVVD